MKYHKLFIGSPLCMSKTNFHVGLNVILTNVESTQCKKQCKKHQNTKQQQQQHNFVSNETPPSGAVMRSFSSLLVLDIYIKVSSNCGGLLLIPGKF